MITHKSKPIEIIWMHVIRKEVNAAFNNNNNFGIVSHPPNNLHNILFYSKATKNKINIDILISMGHISLSA